MEQVNLSWNGTDISQVKSLEEFPYFSFINIYCTLLNNILLLIIIGIKYYYSHIQISTYNQKLVQEVVNLNPQKAILIGTVIGLLISLLVIGSLIETYFSIEYSNLNIPEWIKRNKRLDGFGIMYAGLKSPSIVPKGFDTILAVGFGTFGILLYIFLILINKEQSPLISNLSFLVTYSIIFYSLMRSVFIVFDRYALVNVIILFFLILSPPYLLSKQVFSNQLQSLIIYWVPIISLYILPVLSKLFQKRNKEVLIS